MASEKALQMAAKAWGTDMNKSKVMDPDLAEAFAEIIDKYRDALIWCGGSDDFGQEGKARIGYNKFRSELLEV